MPGTWYHAPVDHPKSVTLASAQSPASGLISKAGIAARIQACFLFELAGDEDEMVAVVGATNKRC